MTARIFRPAKAATQSGRGKSMLWQLEFDRSSPRVIEPLMGWTGSADMNQQVKLQFDSKEEAIAYADRNGLAYRVEEPKDATRKLLSYSDNFKNNRTSPWTH